MKYVIYLRVSGDKQTIEQQLADILKYLKRQAEEFNYIVYADPDTSTKKKKMEDRPQLMEMLDALRSDDQVVVYKLDRFARDIIEMVTIHRMIKAKGCRIHSLNDSNADDELYMSIMGAIAQKERETLSIRIKSKLDYKREKGEKLGGKNPYGYVTKKSGDCKKLIPNPDEQPTLNLMMELFDQGLSYRNIARELTRLGHMNRLGKPFQQMTVYNILLRYDRSRIYIPEDYTLEQRQFLAG